MRRSKFFDIGVLVAVLVLTAALARNFRSDPVAALKADLQGGLAQLYENPNAEIDFKQRPEPPLAVDAEIRLRLPPERRDMRGRWAFGLTRFLAARHPEVRLNALRISDSGTRQDFIETIVGSQSVESKSGRTQPFESLIYFESARGEVLRRSAQAQLDSLAGTGNTLLLVDAVAVSPAPTGRRSRRRAASPPQEQTRGERAQGKAYMPRDASSDGNVVNISLPPRFEVARVNAVLVLQGAAVEKREQLESIARSVLQFNGGRGDSLRVIVLGAP